MPMVPICIYCRKSMDTDNDKFVLTNKDEARYDSDWKYAHPDCHDKHIDANPPQPN